MTGFYILGQDLATGETHIYKTDANFGSPTFIKNLFTGMYPMRIYHSNVNEGFLMGLELSNPPRFIVQHTSNGWASRNTVYYCNAEYYPVGRIDATENVVIISSYGQLIRTYDKGANWDEVSIAGKVIISASHAIGDVWYLTATDGAGYIYIYKSVDNCANWEQVKSFDYFNWSADLIDARSYPTGYLVGEKIIKIDLANYNMEITDTSPDGFMFIFMRYPLFMLSEYQYLIMEISENGELSELIAFESILGQQILFYHASPEYNGKFYIPNIIKDGDIYYSKIYSYNLSTKTLSLEATLDMENFAVADIALCGSFAQPIITPVSIWRDTRYPQAGRNPRYTGRKVGRR